MKKLLVFGLALGYFFSACSVFQNPLEPIPSPYWGWQYVQAKKVDGTALCALNNGVNTNGSGSTIIAYWTLADLFAVDHTNGAVALPVQNGGTADVVIETTLSHWSVEGIWDGTQCVAGTIEEYNDPDALDGVTRVTMHFAGFDLIWYKKMLIMPDIPGLTLSGVAILKANRFSNTITIRRTTNAVINPTTIVVKASGGAGGWVDITKLWSGFSYYAKDCYTAFKITSDDTPASRINYFWQEYAKLTMPTSITLTNSVPATITTTQSLNLPNPTNLISTLPAAWGVSLDYSIVAPVPAGVSIAGNVVSFTRATVPADLTGITVRATLTVGATQSTKDYTIAVSGPNAAQRLELVNNSLTLDNITYISSNVERVPNFLPLSSGFGGTITWTVNNANITIVPGDPDIWYKTSEFEVDNKVTFTATITLGGLTTTKNIIVTFI